MLNTEKMNHQQAESKKNKASLFSQSRRLARATIFLFGRLRFIFERKTPLVSKLRDNLLNYSLDVSLLGHFTRDRNKLSWLFSGCILDKSGFGHDEKTTTQLHFRHKSSGVAGYSLEHHLVAYF